MSSPAATALARAAIMRNVAFSVAGKRQFSMVQSLRTLARSIEAHPFERLPANVKSSASADWGRQFKRVGRQMVV